MRKILLFIVFLFSLPALAKKCEEDRNSKDCDFLQECMKEDPISLSSEQAKYYHKYCKDRLSRPSPMMSSPLPDFLNKKKENE